MLVGESATCTSKHICFTQYGISVGGFHTASLLSNFLLLPQYLHILLQDFVTVLYWQFFLVFGATLGVVPLTTRTYKVNTFWFKHHFIG